MRVETLCFTRPYWSFNWKLDPEELAVRLSEWLRDHQDIIIQKIHHDVVGGFWYPPQLIVTIYFQKNSEKG